jgi:polyisoprenoid-binding protein YceI
MDALLCALWLLQVALQPQEPLASLEAPKSTQQIDPMRSRASFTVHPRWQSAMTGKFESPTGTLDKLADGRLRVEFSLQAASVTFPDSPRITSMTRSEAFFDAAHHPIVHFRSDPFSASLLRDGGTVSGVLDLRGMSKPVRFVFGTADCQQPGAACPLRAAGTISRYAFGMTRYKWVVRDEVDIAVDVSLQISP